MNTYRGEFLLWCGAYAEAAAAFSASLERDRATKWAWIGLGATWMLRGDRKRALETWDEGLAVTHFAGPTLWAYKGECLRREGRYAEAREALEVARETSPRRLATHINLALLDAIDGDPDRCATGRVAGSGEPVARGGRLTAERTSSRRCPACAASLLVPGDVVRRPGTHADAAVAGVLMAARAADSLRAAATILAAGARLVLAALAVLAVTLAGSPHVGSGLNWMSGLHVGSGLNSILSARARSWPATKDLLRE